MLHPTATAQQIGWVGDSVTLLHVGPSQGFSEPLAPMLGTCREAALMVGLGGGTNPFPLCPPENKESGKGASPNILREHTPLTTPSPDEPG